MTLFARWRLPEPPGPSVESLRKNLGLEPPVASILVARGYADPQIAREFLAPELGRLADPFAMADMRSAVDRLWNAIRKNEPILLYGDYDVDGTCSIVILKKTIEILGGVADFHIPHRLREGYGMRPEVIAEAAAAGVRLVISVDTGIRAAAAVHHANALGLDVIVTDHHLPEAELPPALAVLNPNRPDCSYPNKHLCGAGVTFKLVQGLLRESDLPSARQDALLDSFLKPAAIATVADIVPLLGENRVIVKRGLSGLRTVRNQGLRALLAVAGFTEGESPTAHQVAFRLAPRINAAGRMNTARDVIDLFLTEDSDRAAELARQLDELNRERQRVEAEIVEFVLKSCEESGPQVDSAALVFAGEGWPLGVLGIVASRLVERFCRPVFVLSTGQDKDEQGQPTWSGSGRSIRAFHLLEALESMPELFRKFGGHRQAAGVTLNSTCLTDFRERLHLFASSRLTADDFRPVFEVDCVVDLPDLTEVAAHGILSLGPFGFGNPAPLLLLPDAELIGWRELSSSKHATLKIRQSGRVCECKAWNLGERISQLPPGVRLDLLVQIEDDPYSRKRGYGSWCLILKDFRARD